MKTLPGKFWLGISILCCFLLLAIVGPYFVAPPDISLKDRFLSPGWAHLMGTDQNGMDIFSGIIQGAQSSLFIAFTVVTISAIIGLCLGSLAGFWGGLLDLFIMRLIDMIYAFPGFLLALSLVAVMGPSLKNLTIAMCISSWTSFARLVRGEVLRLRDREFVHGAEAIGAGPWRRLIIHIWPNIIGVLLVQITFSLSATIVTESGLSFLGLGAPASTPTWGAMINSGRRALQEAPHISLFPGISILLLVLGLNFIGDGLRTYFNPRIAARRADFGGV